MIRPRRLAEGDLVALVSPSGVANLSFGARDGVAVEAHDSDARS